jgi:hypothetical protein
MVSKDQNYIALAAVVQELEDDREHLGELIHRMTKGQDFSEADLRADLGHVYSHLNRAWHMRNAAGGQVTDFSDEQWRKWSQSPRDLEPI